MVSRQKNSVLTEEKILEAALELFSKQGYAATATSQIANVAQVSEGTVFKYFPKKMDLLRRVLFLFIERYSTQIIVAPLEKILEAHKDSEPKEMLKAIIFDRMALLDKMAPFLKVILTEVQYYPEIREIFIDKVLSEVRVFGDKAFSLMAERGYFRELPSFIPLRSFAGAVGLMIFQRKLAPESVSSSLSLEDEIEAVLDIFLNGVIKQEA